MHRVLTRAASIATIIIIASGVPAQTQPITKRAVDGPTVQATALTARTSSAVVQKRFFVAYGGQVSVFFSLKSDGAHQADVKVFFDGREQCGASTSSATYQHGFGCGSIVAAGGHVDVTLFPNGAPAGICCVRLKFNLVDVNTPGVTLQD
jgi:hypothetical protein